MSSGWLGMEVDPELSMMIWAPAARARVTSVLAELTESRVPITKRILQISIFSTAWAQVLSGISSPKATTAGFTRASQVGQVISRSCQALWTGHFPCHLQFKHFRRSKVPCSSITCLEPDSWCSPSTFWVMTQDNKFDFSSRASEWCPWFGIALFTVSLKRWQDSQ